MQLAECHTTDQWHDPQVSVFTMPHGMVTIRRCGEAGIDTALSVKDSGFARLGGWGLSSCKMGGQLVP